MADVATSTRQDDAVLPLSNARARSFRVAVLTRDEVMRCPHWKYAFANERKDHRYYEVVEDTIHPEFDYRYLAIVDETGEVRAVQPCFLLDQDIFAGSSRWMQRSAEFIRRRLWPRFMLMRTLMVGCAAGEGHLDTGSDLPRHLHAELLAAGITSHARDLKARLIVLKEFPAADRAVLECFLPQGYARVPSMPMTRVGVEYKNFEEYMTKALSGNTRSKLRKKFRATERLASLDMSVVRDITPFIDEVYPLYLDVYERATLRFEKLTKEYFCDIGQRMPDKVRFFLWRREKQIVGFGLCMIEGTSFCSEYIGFDYNVAFDLNLYYVVVRGVMAWAIANGYKCYRSTGLNYEPKFHLRYLLDPLDLYVKHTSPIVNFALKHILPLMEPTRYDKNLKRFSNYAELWPPKP